MGWESGTRTNPAERGLLNRVWGAAFRPLDTRLADSALRLWERARSTRYAGEQGRSFPASPLWAISLVRNNIAAAIIVYTMLLRVYSIEIC